METSIKDLFRERLTIIKLFLGLGESLSREVEENSWSYYNLDFDCNEDVCWSSEVYLVLIFL